MNFIRQQDLSALALGAAILGSGGGGDPDVLYSQSHFLLEDSPVNLISATQLPQNYIVVPIALVGAPLISLERIPTRNMFSRLVECVKAHYPQNEIIIMPAEIGGCNAFSPLVAVAKTAIPVLDGDLIGRAFPKLNMCKPAVTGQKRQVSFVSNSMGEVETVVTETIEDLEKEIRILAIASGCCAAVATFIFSAEDKEKYLIEGSLSRAIQLGSLLQQYHHDINLFAKFANAKQIASGRIAEVRHRIENGFLMGDVNVKTENGILKIVFQNEYLFIVEQNASAFLAESPEIIVIIEKHSGVPLTSESLRYGLNVEILTLQAPAFWELPEAFSTVNINAFISEVNDV